MEKEDESSKQTPRKPPDLSQFEQANSDFALALAMQEQERPSPANLSTIESESEEEVEDDEEEISSDDDDEYEYFESQDFDQFLEEQYSNYNADEDYMEEDDIDPDELSYEELVALGEFIGAERRGLSLNEISSCLHEYKFASSKNNSGIDRCVVCQIEYEENESLVVLPCEHPYHSECISKWLQIKKVCPICSTEASSSSSSPTNSNEC